MLSGCFVRFESEVFAAVFFVAWVIVSLEEEGFPADALDETVNFAD